MRTSTTMLWTLGLTLLVHTEVVLGNNLTASNTATDGQEVKRSPIEEGLRPFYDMTTIFLGIVQRKNIVDDPVRYQEFLDMLNSTLNGDPDSIDVDDLTENWEYFVKHYLGYTICVAVGILFIILMPIVGLCFCCCRCCGHCGGKSSAKEGRFAKPMRITCGTFLFLITIIMLTGMVFAFLSNEQLRVQTSSESEGVVSKFSQHLDSVDMYFTQSTEEATTSIVARTQSAIQNVISTLTWLPRQAFLKMEELTNSGPLLATARSLANNVDIIQANLETIVNVKNEIVNLVNALRTKLQDLGSAVSTTLSGCTSAECDQVRNRVAALDASLDFSQSAQDVTDELNRVQNLVSADLPARIDEHIGKYEEIKTKVNSTISGEISKVQSEASTILDQVKHEVQTVKEQLKPLQTALNDTKKPVRDIQPYLERYGNYRWYGCIALCCVFLLIVLCFFMGLAFGAWGERPYDDARICNKGVGANLLLAGVGFCFLFSWLLMLVCMILFLPGGVAHTEVCRHITPIPTKSKYLDLVDILTKRLMRGTSLRNNVSTILRNCQENQGIYSALGLHKIIPLDNVFDIDKYNVRSKLDELKNLNVDLNDVEIISAQTKSQLQDLGNAKLDNINFDAFYDELDKATTTEDLSSVENDLRSLANDLRAAGETAKADELEGHADTLKSIGTTDKRNIEIKKDDLRTAVDGLRNAVDQDGMTLQQKTVTLITDLEQAQTKIKNDGALELRTLFINTSDNLYSKIQYDLNGLKKQIESDLGRCRPLYQSLSGVVNIFCVNVLNPFNGFWFSFGWCLAFFIPSIIIAVKLAGLYRKTVKYDSLDNKSFDDPNFDAYTGVYPGDNIPLEDYDRRKNYRQASRGQPNTAYETDNYPSSRNATPTTPYNENYNRDNYNRNGGPAHPPTGGGPKGGGAIATPPNPPHYYNGYDDEYGRPKQRYNWRGETIV